MGDRIVYFQRENAGDSRERGCWVESGKEIGGKHCDPDRSTAEQHGAALTTLCFCFSVMLLLRSMVSACEYRSGLIHPVTQSRLIR